MSPPARSGRDGETWPRVEQQAAAIIEEALRRIDDSSEQLAADDVHGLRVACKRLRALWRMLEPSLGSVVTRPAERALRDAARQLAGQRQAAVLLQTLRRLSRKADKARDRDIAADLARRLASAIAAPAAVLGLGPGMRDVFTRQQVALAALPRRPNSEDLLQGVLAGVARSRRFGQRARRRHDATLWHRCRRWVKYEHYQLELLLRPKGALRQRQRRLERLGDLLGRHQDGFDLEQQLAGSPAAVALPEPATATLLAWREESDADRLLACVRRQQRRLLTRVEQRFDVLYGPRFEQLEALLRAAMAQT